MNSKMKSFVKGILLGLVSRAEFPQGKEPAEQWETIWEGVATTKRMSMLIGDHYTYNGDLIAYGNNTLTDFLFMEDEQIRLTVDGNSYVYTAEADPFFMFGGYRAGNRYLLDCYELTDSGGDYAVSTGRAASGYGLQLHSRTEGTYTIKVEKKIPAV